MTDLIDETKRDKCPLATFCSNKRRSLCSSKYLDITMQILSSSIFFVDKYVPVRLEYFPWISMEKKASFRIKLSVSS